MTSRRSNWQETPLVDDGVDRQMTFFDEMRQESVARFGHIDRRTQEGSSRLHALLYVCHPRLVNGYINRNPVNSCFCNC